MMRNPAFSPLNSDRLNPESEKQTKYRVASLLKILRNCPFGGFRSQSRWFGWICSKFHGVWLICRNRWFCYPNHSLGWRIDAVSGREKLAKDSAGIGVLFYTSNYIEVLLQRYAVEINTNASAVKYFTSREFTQIIPLQQCNWRPSAAFAEARDGFAMQSRMICQV
jgi:hypothetical protein